MENHPGEDSKKPKVVKLRPRPVEALHDHLAEAEKLAKQILITTEILARDLKSLLQELDLIKAITRQKG